MCIEEHSNNYKIHSMESSIAIKNGANSSAVRSIADYNLLAGLFMYPENEAYSIKVNQVYDYLVKTFSEAALSLQPFVDFAEASSIVDIQELFLRSFDVQAITTLDIGFILFGEDYKRGKLLVHLNEEHRKAGNNCDTELSDHLPNLLRLLPKISDEEMQAEMARLLLLPAIEKMISEFSFEKIEKKDAVYKKHQKVLLEYSHNHRTVYQNCLWALFLVLQRDFGYEPELEKIENATSAFSDPNNPAPHKADSGIKDFSQHIETEMLTEK